MLTRYWLNFDSNTTSEKRFAKLALGIGVTAYSLEDASKIIKSEMGIEEEVDKLIVDVKVNVNVDEILDKHVIGHLGIPSNRGIWFPALNRDGHLLKF